MLRIDKSLYSDELDFYCSDGYSHINNYILWNDIPNRNEECLQTIMKMLDKLFQPATNDMILYRGITHQFSEGNQQCYISTSKDFTSNDTNACLLQIHIKKGQMIIDTELHDCCCSEREVILPTNTYLHVIEKKDDLIICEVTSIHI